MQRYFVSDDLWDKNQVTIEGKDVHHIVRVMRMEQGTKIICIHSQKGAALCEILEVTDETVIAGVIEWLDENRELPVDVTIVQSLGKGDKMEQVVQKGTELGAHRFIPFAADRSVAKWDSKKIGKKIERLEKIAKEASEQSERMHIPMISTMHKLQDLVKLSDDFTYCFFGYAESARQSVSLSLHDHLKHVAPGDSVLVVFGPEGGLSDEEVSAFKNHGFESIRLGRRILRMETAPLYFLSSLSYQLEEQGQL
ncbi:16S rRNA (uracil(1498)-N(3))-methyltransferase [Halobacillus locisalis]|uniref:Ribosomal RNA small subunit methyltransferase E n=1 Tax=Halobacillus locisalis TaxID=220753 RepID=A0A838CPH8_9BACI|nr:16S rRNA (uracil(1498)-N(3))-methyltransferase [Halobacillus locisalis]MBA2173546.1 16S rRNA (uracil(1498)-N(3))-methyltransferase [Halobacillus locisalis]